MGADQLEYTFTFSDSTTGGFCWESWTYSLTDSNLNEITDSSAPFSFDATTRIFRISTVLTSYVGVHTFIMTIVNPLLTEEPNMTFQETFTVEVVSGANAPPYFENLVDSVEFFDLKSFTSTDLNLGTIITAIETDTPSL